MTTTLAVPAVPEGVVQVAEVAEVTLKAVHAVPPTVMPVAPVKLVPVIVILVPPAVLPDVGETEVTVGAGVGAGTPVKVAELLTDELKLVPLKVPT